MKLEENNLEQRQKYLIGAGLFLAALILYWPVRHFGFINFDDPEYLQKNYLLQQGLTLRGLTWSFSEAHFANWHPLVWVSYMIECQFFGLRPPVHHLVNVGLHALNGVLVFLLLQRWTWFTWRSAFVAALFLFHPTRVESVAWIAERKDVLSGFFFFLTLWAYTLHVQGPETTRRRNYILAVIFFALGLLSKPMLVTVPFLLLVLDFWPWKRLELNVPKTIVPRLIEKWPFFALTLVFCVITFATQNHGNAMAEIPLFLRFQKALMTIPAYFKILFWPTDLVVLYLFPAHWPVTRVLLATTVVIAVSGLGWSQWRSRPWLLTGWLWFAGMLLPVTGIVQVGSQFIADRFTYLPAIGIFWILTWAVCEAAARFPNKLRSAMTVGPALACLLMLGAVSRQQLDTWNDSQTLWQAALRVDPENYLARNSLGIAFLDLGETNAAKLEFERSVKLGPKQSGAWSELGLIAMRAKDYRQATNHFQEALRWKPDDVFSLANLGRTLNRAHHFAEADIVLKKALTIAPEDISAHLAAAEFCDDQGRFDLAIPHYQEVLKIHPADAATHCNLGIDLMSAGRLPEAITQFENALELDPKVQEFYYYHGAALLASGDQADGLIELRAALRLDPKDVRALNDLAWQLATTAKETVRNAPEALSLAGQACQLTGFKDPFALSVLDAAYAANGRFAEAITLAEKEQAMFLAAGATNDAKRTEVRLKFYRANRAIKN